MQYFESTEPLQAAAIAVSELLRRYDNTPTLLLVSGGSWLPVLDAVDTSNLGVHCMISVLDERLSVDPEVNNFTQLTTGLFYANALAKGCHFIDTRVTVDSTVKQVYENWKQSLKKWHQQHPNGIVLATIGIGNDGHIAGIFPNTSVSPYSDNEWTYSYELSTQQNLFTKRMTVSEVYLKEKVNHAVVYAVGKDKKSVLTLLRANEHPVTVLPARILHTMPSVVVYTDEIVD